MKFGDIIYYCKKKDGVEEYEKPIPIVLTRNYFSLQPASEYSDIAIYGEDITKRYRAFANFKIWGHTFKNGDKLYVDYAKPCCNETNAANANAEITAVMYQNLFIRIEIRKLV